MKLNRRNIEGLEKRPEKILQFGEGNFIRGFFDWQIEKINERSNFNAGVVVIQPREKGRTIQKLINQEGLFTVFLQGIKNGKPVEEHCLVSCINRCVNPYENYSDYLDIAKNSELRFVTSNTTEAGIVFDENDRTIKSCSKSYPGKLTALLYERFKFFNGAKEKGLIMIPCELIEKNGEKLKEIILKYAKLWKLEEQFTKWLEEANTFCNTLVDRIVPGYPKDKEEEIIKLIGYEDEMLVVGEQFSLLVIEGPSFIKDELPIEKSGLNIKLVNDVTPYRNRKVRILNGAHSALVPVAYLYGLKTVKEAVDHEVVGRFIEELIYEEIIPSLKNPDISQSELKGFAGEVLERFDNPFIKHYLISIALNSISKFETRDLPSMIDYIKIKKKLPKRLTFSLASLICFYKGVRGKELIKLSDDDYVLDFYNKVWESCNGSEGAIAQVVWQVLDNEKMWKGKLHEIEGLLELVVQYVINIEKLGMEKALKDLLSEEIEAVKGMP